MASPTVAANAYASLAKIVEQPGAAKGGETGGPSFSALLKDAIGSVVDPQLRVRGLEGLRVIEAELAGGKRLVQLGYMRRFDPGYVEMKGLLDSGTYGEALAFHCVHRNASAPPHFDGAAAIVSSCGRMSASPSSTPKSAALTSSGHSIVWRTRTSSRTRSAANCVFVRRTTRTIAVRSVRESASRSSTSTSALTERKSAAAARSNAP